MHNDRPRDVDDVELGQDVTHLFMSRPPSPTLNLTGQQTDSAGRVRVRYEVTPCS